MVEPSLTGSRGRRYVYHYAGSSLVGCRIYCTVRYFPHDTPDECKASIATFEKEAARKPHLWRTNLRLLLLEKCKIPF